MEIVLLLVFSVAVLACVFAGQSILFALSFGFVLFMAYGLRQGKSLRQMLIFAWQGVRTVKTILIMLLLIGILTASWRASGSVAYIVYHAAGFCSPGAMVLATFLLCSLISFLMGTAFGSAATIGTICMTMANAVGVPVPYTAGAVLAGVYFGDRCSPISTSALLVSELTQTKFYRNLVLMARDSVIPMFLSCAIYYFLGLGIAAGGSENATQLLLAKNFHFTSLTLLPVVVVLIFPLLRIKVLWTLGVSTILALGIAVGWQNVPTGTLLGLALTGFQPQDAELAAIMRGGGVYSMVGVCGIVGISSTFAGIFTGTHFLDGIEKQLKKWQDKISVYGLVFIVSILTSAIACNQTLAIMLTHQLCEGAVADKQQLALDMENTVVLIAPLIPWSIAGNVPITTVGGPLESILFAAYLFVLPVWHLLVAMWQRRSRAVG